MDLTTSHAGHVDLAALIDAVALGDESAFARLYDSTSDWVFNTVQRIVKDHAVAEEITLDVYWQVWRSAGSYHRGKGSPITWLGMLSRSRAIDHWRSVRDDWKLLDDFPLDEIVEGRIRPDGDASRHQQNKDIEFALQQLAMEQRSVIYLAYFGGFSQSEIAERLNMPIGSVKTHARQGLMKLRSLLSRHESDFHD